MGQRWSAATVAAIVIVAGAIGGCGSSGSDDPEPLTRAEFTQQADAICRDVVEQVSRLEYPKELAGFRQWGAEMIKIQENGIDQLAEIIPPANAAETFDALRTVLADKNTTVNEAVEATLARDRAALRSTGVEGTRQQQRITRLANELGLRTCAVV